MDLRYPLRGFQVQSGRIIQYPYKTKVNGEWKPSRQGLIAAKKRAAQQHDTAIENKADRLLNKYFASKKK